MTLALMAAAAPAPAQFGSIFGNDPPRPPGSVPGRGVPTQRQDSEFGSPSYPPPRSESLPPPGAAPSGPPVAVAPSDIQSQPLPPPPGMAVPDTASPTAPAATPGQPAVAAQPPAGQPPGGQPPAGQPTAEQPPAGQPGAPASQAPSTATAAAPKPEEIVPPPAHKIENPTAVFAGLDKITGRIISFDVKMGETVQFGALQVTPRACYTRPSDENQNTDGFVQVDEVTLKGDVKRIFDGWMFASSPGLHGVEHPIYDVWLTSCKGGTPTVTAAAPPPEAAPPPPRPQRSQQPRRAASPPPTAPQAAPPQALPPPGLPPR